MTTGTIDSTPLHGLRVLITRPTQQQAVLCQAITRLGGVPVSLPLIAISPREEDAAQKILRSQVQALDNYRLLIFVSTNAARFGAELIDEYWPQFPVGVEVMAIGPTTAAELRQRLDCPVTHAESGMDSEAILDLPQLQRVAGERIAIFRGQGGRELLAATLRERGARVDYIEVYTRHPAPQDPGRLGELLQDPGLDVVTVTSAEALPHLLTLAGEHRERLGLLPLVVPSARVADLASAAGFARVIDAGGANEAALVRALQEIAAGAKT
ncbi:MAG: uroporphyrinogen-III synthase [Pseudohongiellaceae bacterium]